MIPWLFRPASQRPKGSSRTNLEMSDDARRTTHMAASLLLDYPEASRRSSFATVRATTAQLPPHVRDAFAQFFDATDAWSDHTLESHYIEMFDEKRKCCPYLTYYAAGDTRRRGMALVHFAEAYREAGWEMASGELPDYLPAVLEFSARSDSAIPGELLGAHRDGVEVLRKALARFESPYRHVMEAVCVSLPEIDEATRERYQALISEGPPVETVGLDKTPITLEPYSARQEA